MTEVLVGGEICSECDTSLNEIIFEDHLNSSAVEVIGPPKPNFPKECSTGKVPSVEKRVHEASLTKPLVANINNRPQDLANARFHGDSPSRNR